MLNAKLYEMLEIIFLSRLIFLINEYLRIAECLLNKIQTNTALFVSLNFDNEVVELMTVSA